MISVPSLYWCSGYALPRMSKSRRHLLYNNHFSLILSSCSNSFNWHQSGVTNSTHFNTALLQSWSVFSDLWQCIFQKDSTIKKQIWQVHVPASFCFRVCNEPTSAIASCRRPATWDPRSKVDFDMELMEEASYSSQTEDRLGHFWLELKGGGGRDNEKVRINF